jgi:hypothetical protein
MARSHRADPGSSPGIGNLYVHLGGGGGGRKKKDYALFYFVIGWFQIVTALHVSDIV